VVPDEPVDTVRLASLFIGGECDAEVAVGYVPFAFHAKERIDKASVTFLDILRAATVEEAVFLGEGEGWGVGGPVGLVGFDDV
jgi:hypothetical protein